MSTCAKALGAGLVVASLLVLCAVLVRIDATARLDAYCRAHHFDRGCDAASGCGWLDGRLDACLVSGVVYDPALWKQGIWRSTATVPVAQVPDLELEALNQQRTWCRKL
jgi:hypothetical protein